MTSDRSVPLWSLPGEPPDPASPSRGCPFEPRCDAAIERCGTSLPVLEPTPVHPGAVACIRHLDLVNASTRSDPMPERVWPIHAPRSSDGPVLRLHGVRHTFSGRQASPVAALAGIDLEVDRGEVLAVVGESGCGKSTLLRVVAGLIRPDGGTVELRTTVRPQLVFQDAGASLTPWLTVNELVGERLRKSGLRRAERREQVLQTLRLVGCPEELASARAAELSGGQRQRVALARAVIVPPELLLCDEPTSALDVSLVATVLNLLGRIRRELGMAMIFVTHDLAAARLVSDRVIVMRAGEILEQGPSDEVCEHPQHPYTRELLAALPGRRPDLTPQHCETSDR